MHENLNSKLSIGVVAIGRNEGERLRDCLISVSYQVSNVVYVDSGSTDNSVDMARNLGVEVVNLDMTRPFTAARARNEGFRRLKELNPTMIYVQFVDGDCEVVANWLSNATQFLEENKNVAVVCGRRRERFPDHSVYNMLCDIEWDTPIGEAKSCGGDAMMRVTAYEQVDGFRDSLIAGEEPELCIRIRNNNWKIWRLGVEMTLHDAAIIHFKQWWKRSMRCGYAYAEGAFLHGACPERHRIKASRSVWIWGVGIPAMSITASIFLGFWGFAILLVYPAQFIRLGLKGKRSMKESWVSAFFLMLGKLPEVIGQIKFLYNRLTGNTSHLIEYK